MEKKIYRRINLIKSLVLFIIIVSLVLINLLVYSNIKSEKNNDNILENKILVEK